MRVRLKTVMAGPDGVFHAGSVIDPPVDVAEALIAAGYAERLERQPETAAFEPASKAVKTAPRPRKVV
jgi:hypothetical protein